MNKEMNREMNKTNKGEVKMNALEKLNEMEKNNQLNELLNKVPTRYLEERDYVLVGINDFNFEIKDTKDGKSTYSLWSFEFKIIIDNTESILSVRCFDKDIINLARYFNERYKTNKTAMQVLRHIATNAVEIPMYGYYPLDRVTKIPLPYLNIGFGERKIVLVNDKEIKEMEGVERA